MARLPGEPANRTLVDGMSLAERYGGNAKASLAPKPPTMWDEMKRQREMILQASGKTVAELLALGPIPGNKI